MNRSHAPLDTATGIRMVIGLFLAIWTALSPLPASGKGHAEGEEIVVTGAVTDPEGKPVSGVTLELRGTRMAFSLRDFRIARRGMRSIRARSDVKGVFEIRWPWHPYYNRFELAAGVDLSGSETAPDLEVLATTDLSRRIRRGNPVVVTVEIPDRSTVDNLNAFLSTLGSPDELEVYQEMGKPDKVRDTAYPGYVERTWWYFDRGKVFRFRSGTMRGVEEFDPISELPD